MNRTNGKIAEQSKMKIAKALLSVMKIYDFQDITVTQIAQEAGLSRKTFYRLFSGKEDVLMFLFTALSADCMAQIRAHNAQRYWDVVQLYFNFFETQKDLLMLLKRNNLAGRLFEVSYQHAFCVFESIRSKEVMDSFAPLLPYLLAYSIGGMNSMLLKWVGDDMRVPSSALIETLKSGFMSAML